MAISSAVKMVIPSVSRAEYSISSSGMQNAAAVLPSKSKCISSLHASIRSLAIEFTVSGLRFLLPAFETEMSTEHSFRRHGGDGGRHGLSQSIVWCSLINVASRQPCYIWCRQSQKLTMVRIVAVLLNIYSY